MRKIFTLFALCATMMAFATDWSSIAWLGDGAGNGAYADKYKVEPAFGQNVVNIQQPGFAAKPGIYTNFPAGISTCSLNEGDYVIDGAGMILYLDAFTAKETAVTVEAGSVNYSFKVFYADGTGEVGEDPEQGGGDTPTGDLTPAKYSGSASVEVSGAPCVFNWSITRNADATLTFEISWVADIVGAVPQICLDGAFTTMPAQEKKAIFTTQQTYEDGATLNNTFFYVAYAGGAARVDITGYVVGASNEPTESTAFNSILAPAKSRKIIENGQVIILKNGVRYNLLGSEIK